MNIIYRTLCVIAMLAIALPFKAQISKNISLDAPADNYTIKLEGDKSTKITFVWTSASINSPGTTISYHFVLDTTGGSFTPPWAIINKQCCASFFINDTTAQITQQELAAAIDNALKTKYNKSFKQGESITLDWNVLANAIAPGPVFENRQATPRTITIIRGQFNDEYVPVNLVSPLDNSSFFVQDNDVVKIKFTWTKAYCPSGCAAPEYQLMFDSMGGDFSNPLYFISIPKSPFDTIWDLRQDVLAQMLYDDGIARNAPKTYKWTVKILGNSQEVLANQSNRISLLRGLMKTEHVPFYQHTPVDNAIFKLEIKKTDSVMFTWSKTQTGYPDQAGYKVLFDSVGAGLNFNQPLFAFKTGLGDTAFKATYIALRDSIDKVYGIHWKQVKLRWTVQADVIGYKFMSEDTSDILITRGYFTGIEEAGLGADPIVIYPNPSTSEIHIYMSGQRRIGNMKVMDAAGKAVMDERAFIYSADASRYTVDIKSLANGTYFIVWQDRDGTTQSHKFIKY